MVLIPISCTVRPLTNRLRVKLTYWVFVCFLLKLWWRNAVLRLNLPRTCIRLYWREFFCSSRTSSVPSLAHSSDFQVWIKPTNVSHIDFGNRSNRLPPHRVSLGPLIHPFRRTCYDHPTNVIFNPQRYLTPARTTAICLLRIIVYYLFLVEGNTHTIYRGSRTPKILIVVFLPSFLKVNCTTSGFPAQNPRCKLIDIFQNEQEGNRNLETRITKTRSATVSVPTGSLNSSR